MTDMTETWTTRLKWIVVGAVIGALAAVAIPPAVGALLDLFRDDPDVRADLQEIEVEAAESARFVADQRRVETSEGAIWVVVVRHQAVGPNRYRIRARASSDELRIYNETADGLALDFEFEPAPLRLPVDPRLKEEAERAGEEIRNPPIPFLFDIQSILDLDDDGEPEVVGAYYRLAMTEVHPRPLLLSRDRAEDPFSVVGLTAGGGVPPRHEVRGVFAQGVYPNYVKHRRLRDSETGVSFEASATHGFAVVSGDEPVLVHAYLLRADSHAETPTLAVSVDRLIARSGGWDPWPCQGLSKGREHIPAASDPLLGLNDDLANYWLAEAVSDRVEDECPVPPEYLESNTEGCTEPCIEPRRFTDSSEHLRAPKRA